MSDMITTIELDFFEPEPEQSTSSDDSDTNTNTNTITQTVTTPTEEEKTALFEAINDDSLVEPDLTNEDLASEQDDNANSSKWSNSKYTQLTVVGVVFGGAALLGVAALGLFSSFSQPDISQNDPRSENSEVTEDPTAAAIASAENSKAQLILLGESVDSQPPRQKIEDNQTASTDTPTTPTPTNPTSTPPIPNSPPAPTTPRRVATPPPPRSPRPSRATTPPPPPRVTTTPTPQPNHSTVASKPEPTPIDRHALSQRGWSGFHAHSQETNANSSANTNPQTIPNTNTNTSLTLANHLSSGHPSSGHPSHSPSTANDDVPIIRLGNPTSSPSPTLNWDFFKSVTSRQSPVTSYGQFTVTRDQLKLNNSCVTSRDENEKTTLVRSDCTLVTVNPTPASAKNSRPYLSQLPVTFPLGTQLKAKLTTPIIYTNASQNAGSNNHNQAVSPPFTLVLTEHLLTPTGNIALVAGTLMVGRVVSITPSGLVSAEITSIAYETSTSQQPITRAIPSGQILVFSDHNQPLRAQRLNDPSGAIAQQDFFLGSLGAAARGLEYANQPQTQTSIQQNGFGGINSSSTTTNQNVGLVPGLAEGFFSTLKGRMESRANQAITEYTQQVPEYHVPANTPVSLFFNAVLEVNP